jgi:hypothetical protein
VKTFLLTVGIILVLMVGSAFGVAWLIGAPPLREFSSQDWTAFSELYGATVGTLFAGLAFAGVIWTIHLQRRELFETREELRRTADAQAAQVETAKQVAKLNALATLLEFNLHPDTSSRVNSGMRRPMRESYELEDRIKEILNDLEIAEVES